MPASFSTPSSCWRAMTSCRRRRVASPSGSSSPRWRLALAWAARLATLSFVGYRLRRSSCHLLRQHSSPALPDLVQADNLAFHLHLGMHATCASSGCMMATRKPAECG